MAGGGNNARARRKTGHSLYPLEVARRVSFVRIPCIWHCKWRMAWKEMLWTHRRDVASRWSDVDTDTRGWITPSRPGRGCWRLANYLESLRQDSHQMGRRIQVIQQWLGTITHYTKLINSISVRHQHGGLWNPMGSSLPRAGAVVK